MTKLGELIEYLETVAPLHFQENYDNSGLIYGDKNSEIKSVLISLDLTEAVLEEAIKLDCNVVISHHPIIFRGIKKFQDHYVDRAIVKAIKNDIAVYAIHTNLDSVIENGVNGKICDKIGIIDYQILSPKKALDENNNVGAGMIGRIENPMEEKDFLDHLKKSMELKVVKHTVFLGRKVNKIAVCGGSGSFLLNDALKQKADVFITSDFKYHEFFDADGRIVIIDIGHYESERFTINLLYELISNKFRKFAAHCTKVNTNPVKYY